MNQNTKVQTSTPMIPVPQISEIQPTPQIPINTSNKRRGFLLGVLTLLIFASIGGVYYLGVVKQRPAVQKNNNEIAISATATPSVKLIPSITPDPTVNWKTWLWSDESKFLQYKYPNEWEFYEDHAGVGYPDTGNGYYGINVGFHNNNKQLPLEEFVNNISEGNRKSKKLPVSVGNKNGIQVDNYLNGIYYSVIYFEYDDKIVVEIDASGNRNDNQEILTKILSTFVFTQ